MTMYALIPILSEYYSEFLRKPFISVDWEVLWSHFLLVVRGKDLRQKVLYALGKKYFERYFNILTVEQVSEKKWLLFY